MKKKSTIVAQPDKVETSNSEPQIAPSHTPKSYRDHKMSDHHTHGRVNKFPFGSSQGPLCF